MTSRDDERSADGEPDFQFISEVVEAVGVGVGIYGEAGLFVYVNEAYAELLGTDRETLQGRPIWEINPRFDRDRFDDYWASFEEEETRTADTVHAFDGQEVPVQTITTNREINGTWYHFGTVQDITERHEYIDRLRTLNERSRGVMAAESAEEIANTVVEIASEIIDHPITALWTYNEDEDLLIPVAAAETAQRLAGSRDPADGLGPIRPGTTEMEIFRSGESTLIENYQLVDNPSQPESPLGTRLIVPLGDHGLLSIGAAAVTPVDSSDRQLIEILGRNARVAFDRVEQKRTLAERELRLRTIVENAPLILFTVDRDREITLQVGKGLDQVGAEQNEMVGETIEELFGDSPSIIDAVDRSLAGEAVDVTTSVWDRTYQVWYQPIEVAGEVTSVIGVAMDITERKAHEHQIAALHEATREMIQATDEQGVCEIAVRTAEHTLQFPITGIWLADESGDRLESVAATNAAEELFDEQPVYTEGNSLSWRAYTSGESFVFNDLQEEPGLYNPESQVRSELIIPLGDFGVLNMGATAPSAFSDEEIVHANLLAANTEVALDRARRERHLQRQTDQMEFFNSILRHDVLNAVTVIKSRAEFLTDELDGEQLRDAETIVRWSNDVNEIVQQVRTVLETLVGEGEPELEPTELGTELRKEVERIQSTYPEVTFDTTIPDGIDVLANELLGDVLGNIVTNAIDHNDTDGLKLTISVEAQDELVVVRIADNGRGIADDRKEAVFRRDETGHAKSTGSGFGLFFVDVMVTEYGGDVWVEDNDDGGATFLLRLPAAG